MFGKSAVPAGAGGHVNVMGPRFEAEVGPETHNPCAVTYEPKS